MKKMLFFLITTFSSVTIVNAACIKTSMVGTWKIKSYAMGGTMELKCEFTVQKDGKLKNSSCEKDYMASLLDKTPYLVTGNLVVNSNCNVTGIIKIDTTPAPDFPTTIEEWTVDGNLNTKGNDVLMGTFNTQNASTIISGGPRNFDAIKIK